MKLFEENIELVNRYSTYSESYFKYLSISAIRECKEIRNELVNWFENYPDEEKPEFARRFKTDNDTSFNSAFFELYLHNFLRSLDYKINIHPELMNCNNKPDFLVSNAKEGLYLEAVVSEAISEKEKSKRNLFNNFVDALNGIKTKKYFLSLNVRGFPTKPIEMKKIKNVIQNYVDNLDQKIIKNSIESGNYDILPNWKFNSNGYKFEVEPLPSIRKDESKYIEKPIAMVLYGMKWLNTEAYVKKVLKNKINKYKNISKPLIIAFNLLDNSFSEDDMKKFLYGNSTEGFWDENKNTRLSGVLFINNLFPWSVGVRNLKLFINPYAKNTYSGNLDVLPKIFQSNSKVVEEIGKNTFEILQVSENWPH